MDELEKEFVSKKYEYLICNGSDSGLPYGLSVETFRLVSLREAYKSANSKYDLEHVTPYIKRNKEMQYFDKYLSLDLGSYSCTIDTYSDYLLVNKIFDKVTKPEKITWQELLNDFKTQSIGMNDGNSSGKLVLGGVQFGLDYGINNIHGKPTTNEVEKIVKTAINKGVQVIDTARDYGNSEEILGKILFPQYKNRIRISTKLSALSECQDEVDEDIVRAFVRESVLTSCLTLKVDCIDYLLVHRVEDIYKWDNVVLDSLLELRNEGFIGKIGASVQNVDELNLMLDNQDILIIQMPFNILDRRWDGSINKIKKTKLERGLIMHTRSAFLQGLLLTKNIQKWRSANTMNPKEVINWLHTITIEQNRKSITDTCLAFLRSQDWIDGIVIGVDTEQQLHDNLEIFSQPVMTSNAVQSIVKRTPLLSEDTLNPSNWRK